MKSCQHLVIMALVTGLCLVPANVAVAVSITVEDIIAAGTYTQTLNESGSPPDSGEFLRIDITGASIVLPPGFASFARGEVTFFGDIDPITHQYGISDTVQFFNDVSTDGHAVIEFYSDLTAPPPHNYPLGAILGEPGSITITVPISGNPNANQLVATMASDADPSSGVSDSISLQAANAVPEPASCLLAGLGMLGLLGYDYRRRRQAGQGVP